MGRWRREWTGKRARRVGRAKEKARGGRRPSGEPRQVAGEEEGRPGTAIKHY